MKWNPLSQEKEKREKERERTTTQRGPSGKVDDPNYQSGLVALSLVKSEGEKLLFCSLVSPVYGHSMTATLVHPFIQKGQKIETGSGHLHLCKEG